MKQKEKRNPFAVFAVIMLIIAALLIILLIDMTFIPSGEKWEAMKTAFYNDDSNYEQYHGISDKELWEMVKSEAAEHDIIPVKSGFLCWHIFNRAWDEQKAEEEAYKAAVEEADFTAQALKDAVNEQAETTELTDMYAQFFVVHDEIFYISNMGEFLEEDHPLFACIEDVELNTRNAAILIVIQGGKCTAAAFQPDASREISVGVDCPHIAEDGTFDMSQPWGGGFSENGFIIGLA